MNGDQDTEPSHNDEAGGEYPQQECVRPIPELPQKPTATGSNEGGANQQDGALPFRLGTWTPKTEAVYGAAIRTRHE
jgi:hypothetical protein